MIAEDSTLLREGIARLLADEGHEVVATFGSAEGLREATATLRPDVVVADVRMPPEHRDEGLRAALDIRAAQPDVGVLILSQYVERRYAVQLVGDGSGGVGYLLKDRVAAVDEFLDALERVGRGGTAFDPQVVRQLLARTARTDPLSRLTPRESRVLELMAQGHTNAGVARMLYISGSAVEKHIGAIFTKLGITGTEYNNRVLAVLRYLDA